MIGIGLGLSIGLQPFSWAAYWAARGVVPGADATLITTELNTALTNYSNVTIPTAGEYEIDDTIWIPSNTTLTFVTGCIIKKETGSSFTFVFANKGMSTATRNENIKLYGNGLIIDQNGIDVNLTSATYRMMGIINFFRVDGLIIDGLDYSGGGAVQFFGHFSDINNFNFSNINIESLKDGLHFNGKCHDGVVEDITTDTKDDAIAIITTDYPALTGEVGDISDIIIRRWVDSETVQTGPNNALRSNCSSWAGWGNENTYNLTDTCVYNGNLYTKSSAAAQVAANAPVHTTGKVTGADGIEWWWLQSGVITEGNINNITFKDCTFNVDGSALRFISEITDNMRSIYPGTEGNASIDNIVIDNVTFTPSATGSLVYALDQIKKITISNSTITPAHIVDLVAASTGNVAYPKNTLEELVIDNCDITLISGSNVLEKDTNCIMGIVSITDSAITLDGDIMLKALSAITEFITINLTNTVMTTISRIISSNYNVGIISNGCSYVNPINIVNYSTATGAGITFTSDGDTFTDPTGTFLFTSTYDGVILNITNSIGVVSGLTIFSSKIYVIECSLLSLGAELVTNGGFDTASDWGLGGLWTISGGKANADGGNYTSLSQVIANEVGENYLIKYSVTYTSGSVSGSLGNNELGGRALTGNFSLIKTYNAVHASLGNCIQFYTNGAFVGSLDNVTVKKIL